MQKNAVDSLRKPALRPVRSAEFLIPPQLIKTAALPTAIAASTPTTTAVAAALSHQSSSTSETRDELGDLEPVASQFARGGYGRDSSPKCHSRSSSHDSYFEQRKLSVQFKLDLDDEDDYEDGSRPNNASTLDISEIGVNFDLEDNEMKIFSEDEAMVSTSVGSELSLPRSPLLEETTVAVTRTVTTVATAACSVPMRKSADNSSPFVRGTTTRNSESAKDADQASSPTKSRRMSFKDKLRKFTSPTLQRKQHQQSTDDSGLGMVEGGGDVSMISSSSPLAVSLESRGGSGEESAKSLKVRVRYRTGKVWSPFLT